MNNLIRVEDAKLYLAKNYIDGKKSLGQCLDEVPTVNAIEIPDTATNGDVIKALFPDAPIDTELYTYYVTVKLDYHAQNDGGLMFDKGWWNAPYKGE